MVLKFVTRHRFKILLISTLILAVVFLHYRYIYKTQRICLDGKLCLGKVVNIYEPFRKERVDFEIEYTVNGKTYIEKCSDGKYLFYWDDLIWVLYEKDNPESSQAFFQIAEQYEYKGKFTNELDMLKRYEEMNSYVDKCKCIPDSLTQVSYYGFLRYPGD